MEKVVVVVVVTIRDGSRGSGPRLDCENFKAAKFAAASSLYYEESRKLNTVLNPKIKETYVVKELGKDLKNCLWVESSKDTIKVANRSKVSFKNGLPRFVVFIIWEVVA